MKMECHGCDRLFSQWEELAHPSSEGGSSGAISHLTRGFTYALAHRLVIEAHCREAKVPPEERGYAESVMITADVARFCAAQVTAGSCAAGARCKAEYPTVQG